MAGTDKLVSEQNTSVSRLGNDGRPPAEFTPEHIYSRLKEVIVGQRAPIERMLIALLSHGHILLEGPPGVAKTLLAQALAKCLDLSFGRVQFTVDLLPADLLGYEFYDKETGRFSIRRGPIFTHVLLADEINRASPRVQSALLQAMQERKVTLGNETFNLPTPFIVIATQNPLEHAGTFELPDAQLDRFMICHRLSYPSAKEESQIVRRDLEWQENSDGVPGTAFDCVAKWRPIVSREQLLQMMRDVQGVLVRDALVQECVTLISQTRVSGAGARSCGPRATTSLVKAARARAFLEGRSFAGLDDVYELAEDVLAHRLSGGVRGASTCDVQSLLESFTKLTGASMNGMP